MNAPAVNIGQVKGVPHFVYRYPGSRAIHRRKIERPDDPQAVEAQRLQIMATALAGKPTKAAKAKSLPLTGEGSMLAAYVQFVAANGASAKHAGQLTMRIERVFTAAKIRRWSDISVSKVTTAVAAMRCLPPMGLGAKALAKHENMRLLSEQQRNHYYQMTKSFCRWAAEEYGLGENPLKKLKAKRKVQVRPNKRDRFQPDELVKLIAAAERSTLEIDAVNGPTRALLYRLASFTGYRRAELATLRPSSFSFGKQPTVRVAAGYTKNGDEAVLPLNTELVPLLKARLAMIEGDELLFPGLEGKKTFKMVKVDAKAAGLPIRTAEGIRNFHCLRNTFISMLLEGGVDPKTAQLLARHSDINLTLGYARPQKDSDVRAINGLRLPAPETPKKAGDTQEKPGEGTSQTP